MAIMCLLNLLLLLTDTLVMLFTGDVLLDRGVRPLAERHGVKWLFEDVKEDFAQADAVVINLECPLTDVSTPLVKRYIFRSDTHWAKDLREAGITHAALANNHTNDQSYQGLKCTVESLRKAGITTSGAGKTIEECLMPRLITKGSIRVALFNAVLFPLENWVPLPHHWMPCQVDARTLAKAIRDYRQKHPDDRIVAVVHWGIEFQKSPSMKQILEAQLLIDAGADGIIGHHPHVIQPLKVKKGKPIFYSLGNFVFDQHQPEAKWARMAKLAITSDTIICQAEDLDIIQCRPRHPQH